MLVFLTVGRYPLPLRHSILPSAVYAMAGRALPNGRMLSDLPAMRNDFTYKLFSLAVIANKQGVLQYRDMNGRFLTDVHMRRQLTRVIGACVWGFTLHSVIRGKNWVYSTSQKLSYGKYQGMTGKSLHS